jgi:serine/threonine protein kinase
LVGEGAFGKVLLVRNRLDKNLYAMKVRDDVMYSLMNTIRYNTKGDIQETFEEEKQCPIYEIRKSNLGKKRLYLIMI